MATHGGKAARVLGVVRLSRHSGKADDPSTSPERQEGHIETMATQRGSQVVGWAKDLNVSAAKVPPWKRPELSKWIPDLSDDRNVETKQVLPFDAIYFWKLDRLCRSVSDFARMVLWAQVNKVNLVASDGSVDLSTPMGKAMAQIVAVFAELEAAIIKERVNDARVEVLSQGRWHGGQVPYGYMPQKRESGGWELIHNPETAPVLRELVSRVIAGETMNAIAADFDAREIPIPRPTTNGRNLWYGNVIGRMLRNRNMIGEFEYREEIDGQLITRTVQRAEPLISVADWHAVQKAIASPPKAPSGSSLLNGLIFCAECGNPLHMRTMRVKKGDRTYEYVHYICSGRWGRLKNGCKSETVKGEELEEAVPNTILDWIGDLEIFTVKTVGAVDRTAELEESSDKLAELLVLFAGQSDSVKRALQPQIDALSVRVADLEAEPVVQGSTVETGTGETVRQRWAALTSKDDRRDFLLSAGVRVEARKPDSGSVKMFDIPRPEGRDDMAVQVSLSAGLQVMVYLPTNITQRVTLVDQGLTLVEGSVFDSVA